MNLILCISGQRGIQCLKTSINKVKENKDSIVVFTFYQDDHEPLFTEEIISICNENDIDVYITKRVDKKEYEDIWARSEYAICVGWRYIIPKKTYSLLIKDCYVFHDSLLPKYRGFSPTVWALRNGEKETGVTVFQIAENIDNGKIAFQEKVAIQKHENIEVITNRVTDIYLKLIARVIDKFKEGSIELYDQDETAATYVCKLMPEDFKINWETKANTIYNLVRSYTHPYPGAYCYLGEKKITILDVDIVIGKVIVGNIPGRIFEIKSNLEVSVSTGDEYVILIKKISVDGICYEEPGRLLNKIGMTLK